MAKGNAIRQRHNNKYLREYSWEHVRYEFNMLLWHGSVIGNPTRFFTIHHAGPPNPDEAQKLSNTFVESFGVHLRNVFDFFYDGQDGDNVVAADYFATWPEASLVRPKLGAKHPLRIAQKRVSVELAHLTTGRSNPDERQGWDAPGLTALLHPCIVAFAQQALADRIDERLRELYT